MPFQFRAQRQNLTADKPQGKHPWSIIECPSPSNEQTACRLGYPHVLNKKVLETRCNHSTIPTVFGKALLALWHCSFHNRRRMKHVKSQNRHATLACQSACTFINMNTLNTWLYSFKCSLGAFCNEWLDGQDWGLGHSEDFKQVPAMLGVTGTQSFRATLAEFTSRISALDSYSQKVGLLLQVSYYFKSVTIYFKYQGRPTFFVSLMHVTGGLSCVLVAHALEIHHIGASTFRWIESAHLDCISMSTT